MVAKYTLKPLMVANEKTQWKLCPIQAQAVQENAKRPRAGCNIQLIKNIKEKFSS